MSLCFGSSLQLDELRYKYCQNDSGRKEMKSSVKKLEETIKIQLQKTLVCEFKRTIIQHLMGTGWACVKIDTFAKELAKNLEKVIK